MAPYWGRMELTSARAGGNPSSHRRGRDRVMPNYRRNFLAGGSFFFTVNQGARLRGKIMSFAALSLSYVTTTLLELDPRPNNDLRA
jgi:hypothetical protein